MTEVFSELAVIGAPMEDEDKVVTLLASLPESYNVLVTALGANAEVPKMDVVTERLLHEERKLQERDNGARHDENMLMMKSRVKTKLHQQGPQCYGCSEFGHILRDCPEKKYQYHKSKKNKDKYRGMKPSQRAHKAEARWNSDSSSDEAAGLIAEHVLSTTCESISRWIVDSGATCHMCLDRSVFQGYSELKKPIPVTLGDGRKLEAIGQGLVTIKVQERSAKSRKLALHDVLYVPGLSYNLISVCKAAEYGKTVVFKDQRCKITDSHGNTVACADRVDGLYRVRCVAEHKANVVGVEGNQILWHKRFGHLGWSRMNKLTRQDMVSDFTYGQRSDEIFCEQCAEGKQTRNSFKARTEIKAKQPLELVHSDVCGMGAPSLSGSLYFVTFVDDHTRYVWTYMLKRKSEVYSKFREWRAMVEKESGYALRTFRSDNGGEYISSEFEEYLKSQGIRHEYTIPKTPEQNGVAERLNRTLVEKVRCMLADSGLPKVFWAETLSTATYLHNRSPTKPLGGVTPSEAWTGLKPTVGHLRRYGCAAYAHIPKDERSKLDAKSRKCIHLGYGTKVKGYRLYDKAKKQIFHSRDVKFDEANRGYMALIR